MIELWTLENEIYAGGIKLLCGVDEVPSLELIERADRAMYQAKREKRARMEETDGQT